MRQGTPRTLLVLGACLAGGLGLGPAQARGQGAVGFAPTVGTLPDGVMLGVTPVVTADRRYVRLGVQPQFQTVLGFDSYTIPAAVSGGGGFGGGGPGGGGQGGGGFASRGLGPTQAAGGYQVPQFAPSFGAREPRAAVATPTAGAPAPPRARGPRPSARRGVSGSNRKRAR